MYGPGIYLFFKFLKRTAIFFLILACISLIPSIYNYLQGSALSTYKSSSNIYFAKTTIANFSSSTSNDYDKLMNTVSDIVIALGLLAFYFDWLLQSDRLTEEVRREVKMRSYNVLELT